MTEVFEIPEDYKTKEQCLLGQNLIMGQEIDRGAYATVSKISDKFTGELMACKEIRIGQVVRNKKLFDNLKSELFIMCRTRHINLIRVSKHFIIKDNKLLTEFCYLIMEFANGGNVLTRMTRVGLDGQSVVKSMSEVKAKDYFRQTSNGLVYLHRNKISHNDLKLVNILVCIETNGKEVLKITDFGLSRLSYDSENKKVIKSRTGMGTVDYMSPQILRLYIYDLSEQFVDTLREYDPFKADCWALGVCLYCMISARLPFTLSSLSDANLEELKDMYHKMKRNEIDFNKVVTNNYSEDCRQMIIQLLEHNPNKRLDMEVVVRHKWLNT